MQGRIFTGVNQIQIGIDKSKGNRWKNINTEQSKAKTKYDFKNI